MTIETIVAWPATNLVPVEVLHGREVRTLANTVAVAAD